jgi:hypothetical protein
MINLVKVPFFVSKTEALDLRSDKAQIAFKYVNPSSIIEVCPLIKDEFVYPEKSEIFLAGRGAMITPFSPDHFILQYGVPLDTNRES